MRDTTFIYGLFDPRDCRLRYIGKADNPQKRLSKHITAAKKGQRTHKDDWVRLLLSEGLEPAIEVLEECSAESWQEVERLWIAKCREFELDLTNNTDGGEGIIDSTGEIREKIRQKAIGRRHSEETKRKLAAIRPTDEMRRQNSERKKGNKNLLGYKFSEESKQKMRLAKLGKKQPPELVAKRTAKLKGHVTSEETKRKISQSLMGHTFSEETLAKMRKPKSKRDQA